MNLAILIRAPHADIASVRTIVERQAASHGGAITDIHCVRDGDDPAELILADLAFPDDFDGACWRVRFHRTYEFVE